MSRRIRILLGLIILVLSISLLIWGVAPMRREIRIQNISPVDMQLPTPSSFNLDTDTPFTASLTQPWLGS